MYSIGYSMVSKQSLGAQKKMQYRSKGKSCGYYMRIVFFFSSLIQSLIIVSLVLFLIYGKQQDSASVSRIRDLEESFSRLSIENVALRQQRKNLTALLNSTLIEKGRNDWDLARLRFLSNISAVLIQDIDKKLQQCHGEIFFCKSRAVLTGQCPIQQGVCNCGLLSEQQKAKFRLVESNFTQTVQRMRREMDQTARDRDSLNLQVISLRREKFTQEKQVEFCKQKGKDDFAKSLSGVSNVTKAFLHKVDSLFPAHIAFQLTCPKQREHLEQIRSNCSSLSREVEEKFQRYLNNVGEQMSSIQSENSRLKAENWRLSDDYRWCSQNRTGMIEQHRHNLERLQRKHDDDKERLLMDKMRLNGEIQVLDNNVKYKSKEAEHVKEQLRQLNMTCMSKAVFSGIPGATTNFRTNANQGGWSLFGGGGGGGGSSSSSSSSSTGSQYGRTGSGSSSSGLAYNKQGSTGTGSSSTSLLSGGSSSAGGSGYNKLSSAGTGSASTSLLSTGSGSSTGSGLNKLAGGSSSNSGSTGLNQNPSSGGTGSVKPATSGRSTSFFGTSAGSTGPSSSSSSSGIGSNKPTTNVKSTSSSGSSSGSTGSASKSGSGFSWLGFGSSSSNSGSSSSSSSSSSSGQSKSGSGTGKGTSSGSSLGGFGRSSGLGGGSVSVSQHLQDLQRLIDPAGSEERERERQDLSRMLG